MTQRATADLAIPLLETTLGPPPARAGSVSRRPLVNRLRASFRGIREWLFVTRNTVKTQAISNDCKLGVSSRNEAIQRAAELGVVDASAAPAAQLPPSGS